MIPKWQNQAFFIGDFIFTAGVGGKEHAKQKMPRDKPYNAEEVTSNVLLLFFIFTYKKTPQGKKMRISSKVKEPGTPDNALKS